MTTWICGTCGVEHPDTDRPPAGTCLICADERQWVPDSGQVWTTLDKLAADGHELVHEELEPGIHRLNRDPRFGIGQWTHLVQTPQGNLLWDPPNHLDRPLIDKIDALGGAAVIVASHPHMYAFGGRHGLGDVHAQLPEPDSALCRSCAADRGPARALRVRTPLRAVGWQGTCRRQEGGAPLRAAIHRLGERSERPPRVSSAPLGTRPVRLGRIGPSAMRLATQAPAWQPSTNRAPSAPATDPLTGRVTRSRQTGGAGSY